MVPSDVLRLAGEVSQALTGSGAQPIVIGAVALAAHGYLRATEDVDFGIAVDPKHLEHLASVLREALVDVEVTVEMPTPDDPLGGVIDVRRGGEGGDHVQVVNFDNAPGGGFPALVRDARRLPFEFPGGVRGYLASAEDIVFFKLYAGGWRSQRDVRELLKWAQVDRGRLDELAERYNMQRELAEVLAESS